MSNKSKKTSAAQGRKPMRSVRSSEFKALLAKLPESVQSRAADQFVLFARDPHHPALGNEALRDSKRLRPGSRSVRIGLRYRAIFVLDRGPDGKGEVQAFWYWIGSHETYNGIVGSSG